MDLDLPFRELAYEFSVRHWGDLMIALPATVALMIRPVLLLAFLTAVSFVLTLAAPQQFGLCFLLIRTAFTATTGVKAFRPSLPCMRLHPRTRR